MSGSIPVIDFSTFFEGNAAERAVLVEKIGEACRTSGFFQLINHGISSSLQKDLLRACEDFFSLPLQAKESYDKGTIGWTVSSSINGHVS